VQKSKRIQLPFDRNELSITLRILSSNKLSLVSAIVAVVFLIIVMAVWISNNSILPYNPYTFSHALLSPPSFSHPLGTDDLGRDILSRILAGAPIDASVAFSVVAISVILGLFTGGLAGFLGGRTEDVIMRLTDIFLAFPGLVLALAIEAALGPSVINSIIALVPVWWPTYTRLARSEALSVRSNQFIEAARASGQKDRSIIREHIFPNILPILLVYATIDIGNVILIFSVLSFIGLGAQAPAPEWGLMTLQGEQYLRSFPIYPIAPALAILIVAVSFSLVGDGLRDALNPRKRGFYS
jgi:peptide/nickel transport system permease protein